MWRFVKKLFGKAPAFTPDEVEASHLSHRINSLRRREIANLKSQMEHLQYMRQQRLIQEQIEDMRAELYGGEGAKEEDFNEDKLLMTLLAPFLGKMTGQNTQIGTQTGTEGGQPSRVAMSDDEIAQVISQFPKDKLQMFAKLPVETQKKLILSRFPAADDQSIDRAIQILQQ